MTRRHIFLILSLLTLLAFISFHFANPPQVVEVTRFLMGTIVEIKAPLDSHGDYAAVRRAIERAFGEMKRVEELFSVYRKNSEVSRINRLRPGENLKVDPETFDLIEESIEYNKRTEGAFDITVKPLVDLWKDAAKNNALPSEEDIRAARARVGSRYIKLDGQVRTISFLLEGMAIDLGGVAKGYASDRAIAVLKDNGIKNAIVNSGGDLYCLGRKSSEELWSVGIRHPRKKDDIYLEVKLENKAVDTSGDYEKYFMCKGKRYSHIIDPRSGYPAGDDVMSATVIAGDCATADMLATALCVLGRSGLNIIDATKGEDAVVIFKDSGRLVSQSTKDIEKRYEIGSKN